MVSLFPRMIGPVLGESILQRAQRQGRLQVDVHDLRRWTHDRRRTVDDRPYGGGPGMVMKPEPLFEAVEALQRRCPARRRGECEVVLLCPQGERLSTGLAKRLARRRHLVLLCGRYEGVDERVKLALVDRAVSIGDYVLTGGEIPAMVLIDCLARFIPGVIGHAEATREESFVDGLLEYPQYTRPPAFRDLAVPEVLRSGDHAQVARWRRQQALVKTRAARPDLLRRSRAGRDPEESSWSG